MGGVKLESVHCVKDLGVTITSNLKFSQQCKEAACKVNRIWGFINRNFFFKNKDIILPMYISLVQRRATKMITSSRNKSYEERLARLNLFSLSRNSASEKNLLSVLKSLKGLRMLTQTNCFQLITCHERGIME